MRPSGHQLFSTYFKGPQIWNEPSIPYWSQGEAHFHIDFTCTVALIVMMPKQNKRIPRETLKWAPGYTDSPLNFVSFISFLLLKGIIYLEVTRIKYHFAGELLFTEAAINHIIWPSIHTIKIELDELVSYPVFNSTLLQKIPFTFLQLCSTLFE